MKITKEHFQTLREAMIEVMETNPTIGEAYASAGLSETRTAWDIFWHCHPKGGRIEDFSNELYKYLNDTHIGTALLAIYRDPYGAKHK